MVLSKYLNKTLLLLPALYNESQILSFRVKLNLERICRSFGSEFMFPSQLVSHEPSSFSLCYCMTELFSNCRFGLKCSLLNSFYRQTNIRVCTLRDGAITVVKIQNMSFSIDEKKNSEFSRYSESNGLSSY